MLAADYPDDMLSGNIKVWSDTYLKTNENDGTSEQWIFKIGEFSVIL